MRTRLLVALVALAALWPSPAAAQRYVESPLYTFTGNQCRTITVEGLGTGSWDVQIAGSVTVSFYVVGAGGTQNAIDVAKADTPTSMVNSTTATGTWAGNIAAYSGMRACTTDFVAGASVRLFMSAAGTGGGGGGGGGVGGGGDFDISTFQTTFGTAALFVGTQADNTALTQDALVTSSAMLVYDGTNLDLLRYGPAGTAAATVLTVQGIASMTPLLATVTATNLDVQIGGSDTLSTVEAAGALLTAAQATLTSTNFAAAFGTAGTADTQVMSVQGIASMTPILATVTATNLDVQIGGSDSLTIGTFPDNEPFNLAQIAGATAPLITTQADNLALTQDALAVAAIMYCYSGTDLDLCPVAAGGAGAVDANTGRVVLATDDLLTLTTKADEGAFTYANSRVGVWGAVAESTSDTLADGTAGAVNMTLDRKLWVQPRGYLAGGGTGVGMKSDNTNNDDETAICTGPCTVYTIVAFNHAAASAFLRCENDTAANTTPGSETAADGEPDFEIPGNTAGNGFVVHYPVGLSFATALTCWVATGEASSDATDAATDDVSIQFSRVQ